jgi:hypothetical protein
MQTWLTFWTRDLLRAVNHVLCSTPVVMRHDNDALPQQPKLAGQHDLWRLALF